ncbi:acyltransferase [Maridesulfovibrio ferrireducens]|uniref:acyltransferase n=1 Tax=Maridesulfovibrio ferrireducens TaxID=246191 RepID=UPI001A1DA101|nr:acyltransferase [Maridesulfovibrio ferrireducens]MBI9112704.1 N-acetyltransferase [Maridesulfovibrio ferrireducens]
MGYIHPTADIDSTATLGDKTYIWQNVQVRAQAIVGSDCIIGKGAFIDFGAVVGNKVKIQNYSNIFRGVTLEDGVFIGPSVSFTNDMFPRAVNKDGSLMDISDWKCYKTLVKTGAGIGAGSIIVCNNTIGKWAIIGAGSVVTRDVPDYGLVYGNPARLKGYVCPCGNKFSIGPTDELNVKLTCKFCDKSIIINKK